MTTWLITGMMRILRNWQAKSKIKKSKLKPMLKKKMLLKPRKKTELSNQ